ncbi:MAG: hypothetical protein KKF80_05780, partial [Candidatus Omnitrophica bacterium]|nr:hypothetical protein [Candidatus Omnitrophota bacterium]
VFFDKRLQERVTSSAALEAKVHTLKRSRAGFSQKIIQGLYQWIQNRRDLVRGLVMSFEGDRNLDKVCFTYDQALASTVFLIMDDAPAAAQIFDFYLTQTGRHESIYNAYYSNGEPAEAVVHSGPNAWIGIAVLNYTKKTGDRQYLAIAQKVASFLTSMMDSEGGIRGGPGDAWFSTEHNLDAYAFFTLYYQVNGDPAHRLAAEKLKNWISRYAYTSYGAPVKRGKGDATIATDTYAWSISTFGPDVLSSLKMNPETILDFAIQSCEVETSFKRKEGDVTIRGFDFSKFKNMARGGIVSGEWTAQMILSFEVMADYYKDNDPVKYRKYLDQAVFYSNELQKMLITSPSRIGREDPCLPYASRADVDTGHGWRTPHGDSTGSLASTAYFLIAYFGYNPFTADYLDVSLKEVYEGRSDAAIAVTRAN